EEGLEIDRIEGSVRGEALNDGSVDLFAGNAFWPLLSFPNFEGVRLLCALAQYSYWFLGVRADLDIERGDISALKGLRISASRASPGKGLRHMLKEAGLDPDRDVEIVDVPSGKEGSTFRGNDGLNAIKQGIADAFWGNGLRLEIAVRAGVAKPHLDLRRGDGPPGARFYNFPALTATEEFIENHPGLAAGAVRAIVKTQKALKADPTLATKVGNEMFPPQEAEIIAELIARDAPFYDAEVSQEALAGLNTFCVAIGLLEKPLADDQWLATQFSDSWKA
ncbi:MAG: ABC transporter substrate-binding protein, partial [Alphaproteobacteria bacterium]|nr:ABC transporter substrate-binding protein [Alphaproteobacteria bacterium]